MLESGKSYEKDVEQGKGDEVSQWWGAVGARVRTLVFTEWYEQPLQGFEQRKDRIWFLF